MLRGLAAFLALSIPVVALDSTLYSWHPTFMALGFLGLMTEGVLTSAHNLEGAARTVKLQRHMWWQIGSVGCVSAGFAAIEVNKVGIACLLTWLS